MIKTASQSGADAIKLQTVNAQKSYSKDTESYKLFKASELSRCDTEKMFNYARKLGLEPFTTSGDLETLEWVDKLNPVAHKISSGLLSCFPFLKYVSKLSKPIILSSGMSDHDEIDESIKIILRHNKQIILLQCTSQYPCPIKDLHLSTINFFKKKYLIPVGFSDHSLGIKNSVLAVAAGANVIEKHFTFDPTRNGYDHKISLSGKEFKKMVNEIKTCELALGNTKKLISNNKVLNFQRCLAVSKKLKKGHKISLLDLLFLRFNDNKGLISAKETEKILGKKLNKDRSEKQVLRWEDLD